MKKLGIYFGQNAVNVVESDGKKIVSQVQFPAKEGVLQEELRKYNIKSEEAIITLSSRDLLIRSFDLPLMPANEIPAAVGSEAVKYIPFKIEDIIYDYKVLANHRERKNYILFAGIKTEELDDKYLSILSAAQLKPKEIEYAVFSALKLLRAFGMQEKGVFAFLDIDLEDESNITILDDNFPQFSRTLKLPVEESTDKASPAGVLEKLTNEIRISLDFYRRKFPDKEVKKAIVAANPELRLEIENLCRDLGVKTVFINLPPPLTNLGLVKAYAASLDIKLPFEIDLLAGKEKLKVQREQRAGAPAPMAGETVKVNKAIVVAGIALAIGVFALIQYSKIIPLKKEISQILSQRKAVTTVSADLPYPELERVKNTYKDKVATLDGLFKQKQFLTPKFDFIPRLIPDGVWLVDLNFSGAGNDLSLKGAAYLENSEAEIKAINEFVSHLQGNQEFDKSFSVINVSNVKKGAIAEIQVTFFEIKCARK